MDGSDRSDGQPDLDTNSAETRVEWNPAQHSVLTPEGQIESMGRAARGFGAERLRRLVRGGCIALAAIIVAIIVIRLAS